MGRYLTCILVLVVLLVPVMMACDDDNEDPGTAASTALNNNDTSTTEPASPTVVNTDTPTKTPTMTPGALPLVVTEPKGETVVDTSRITVSGTTEVDAVVSINGVIADVDSRGGFTGEVNLDIGPNLIEVIASDFEGNETSAILTVIYATAVPLTISEPLNESVVTSRTVEVRGMTSVDAVVSVNGDIVAVDASGGFSTPIILEEGPNFIEVVASDFSGNSSMVTITVIYTS